MSIAGLSASVNLLCHILTGNFLSQLLQMISRNLPILSNHWKATTHWENARPWPNSNTRGASSALSVVFCSEDGKGLKGHKGHHTIILKVPSSSSSGGGLSLFLHARNPVCYWKKRSHQSARIKLSSRAQQLTPRTRNSWNVLKITFFCTLSGQMNPGCCTLWRLASFWVGNGQCGTTNVTLSLHSFAIFAQNRPDLKSQRKVA